MVLKMEAIRIACRVRTGKYQKKYGNEFTIRSTRPSGAKTELRKIIEGWGDYMFYGFGDGSNLIIWHLLDLKIFRSIFLDMVYRRNVPREIPNKDNSSSFMAFDLSSFPSDLIIASKEN